MFIECLLCIRDSAERCRGSSREENQAKSHLSGSNALNRRIDHKQDDGRLGTQSGGNEQDNETGQGRPLPRGRVSVLSCA